mgnify:CR=1 FL=1
MRLSSLAKLEKGELEKEANELKGTIETLEYVLANKESQIQVLRDRLDYLTKKYGDARRTELTQIDEIKEEKVKVEISPEDVVVVVSYNGDIKRIPKKNFKIQHRNGVGVKSVDNAILTAVSTNTINTLMVFTSVGKMYRLNVSDIPEG